MPDQHRFEAFLGSALRAAALPSRPLLPGECQAPPTTRCTLCLAGALTYDMEFPVKERALREFLHLVAPGLPFRGLRPSPRGRAYRTVSKRKALWQGNVLHLGLVDPEEQSTGGILDVGRCMIEPEFHARIYEKCRAILGASGLSPLAEELAYVIIKGGYDSCGVVFSVRSTSPHLIRAVNAASKSMTKSYPEIKAVFLYLDESDGRYYFGAADPRKFRKVFGKELFRATIGGMRLDYPALAFSQVNLAGVSTLLEEVRTMLRPEKRRGLFDLYCGYGLFGLVFSSDVARVTGVESSGPSVAAALENARRLHIPTARFFRAEINGTTVDRLLSGARPGDLVVLDPPRVGTAAGVISTIAARRPGRVVHLFCNIDLLPRELALWAKSGYAVTDAIAVDMFPGTPTMELVVALEQLESGGRK